MRVAMTHDSCDRETSNAVCYRTPLVFWDESRGVMPRDEEESGRV